MASSLCVKQSASLAFSSAVKNASSSRAERTAACAPRAAGARAPMMRAAEQKIASFEGLKASSIPSSSTFLTGATSFAPQAEARTSQAAQTNSTGLTVHAAFQSKKLANRKLRVAVVGGGPAGGCTADTLASGGIETFLFERKLDNAKPCGGAIPLCMVDEFQLPPEIIDRRVTKMKMISPSNVEVDVGRTLGKEEYIGMCRYGCKLLGNILEFDWNHGMLR